MLQGIAVLVILLASLSSSARLSLSNLTLTSPEQVTSPTAREWNTAGLVKLDEGNYLGAIADFNEAIYLRPRYADAFNNRGIAYYYLYEYDLAIADYTQAIELDSYMAEAYRNRGLVYYDRAEYTQALADFNEALRIDSDYADAYNGRASVYYVQGKYTLALADYTEAIRAAPDFAQAYSNRGLTYNELEQYEQAIADFNRSIELNNPELDTPYLNRGYAYKQLGLYEQAIADYTTAIAMGRVTGYVNRWYAYEALGRYGEAIQDAVSYILAQPHHHPITELFPAQPVEVNMSDGHAFRWTVTLTEGETWRFSATSPDKVDTFIMLFAPDAAPLVYHDDISDADLNSLMTYEVKQSGIYTLFVTHAGGERDGQVNVKAEVVATSG